MQVLSNAKILLSKKKPNAKTLHLVSVEAIHKFTILTGADISEEGEVEMLKKLLAVSEEKLALANKSIEG